MAHWAHLAKRALRMTSPRCHCHRSSWRRISTGLLPDLELVKSVATKVEDHPTPDTNQVIVFIAHFLYGFGVQPSRFLEWICRFYGIKVAHLKPNTVAMLSIFAFLYEAWIGVEPYIDLWHYFYSIVYYSKCLIVGSVIFSLRAIDDYILFPIKCS